MDTWHLYIDESYNRNTFCVGGILSRPSATDQISALLLERIALENNRSMKKGFRPISRYHATDCANLKHKFNEKNGWNRDRQVKLTRRMCEILANRNVTGIVVGGSIGEIAKYCDPHGDPPKEVLYSICFRMCLLNVASLMRSYVVDPEVKVFF